MKTIDHDELYCEQKIIDYSGLIMILTDHDYNILYFNKLTTLLSPSGNLINLADNPELIPLIKMDLYARRTILFSSSHSQMNAVEFTKLAAHDEHHFVFVGIPVHECTDHKKQKRIEQLELAGKMAAKLSHELRNPLASIKAGLDIVSKDAQLSEDNKLVLQLVSAAIQEISRISDQLATIIKRDIGEKTLVDPGQLIRLAAEKVAPLASERQVELKIVRGPLGFKLKVDKLQVSQSLANLFQNAIEASNKHDRIKIGWRRKGNTEGYLDFPKTSSDWVIIFGEDSGKGLPEDLSISSMFKPFTSTKKSGTGIGLSIAEDIIERHGGKLRLFPGSDGGACFEVFLPLSRSE